MCMCAAAKYCLNLRLSRSMNSSIGEKNTVLFRAMCVTESMMQIRFFAEIPRQSGNSISLFSKSLIRKRHNDKNQHITKACYEISLHKTHEASSKNGSGVARANSSSEFRASNDKVDRWFVHALLENNRTSCSANLTTAVRHLWQKPDSW